MVELYKVTINPVMLKKMHFSGPITGGGVQSSPLDWVCSLNFLGTKYFLNKYFFVQLNAMVY